MSTPREQDDSPGAQMEQAAEAEAGEQEHNDQPAPELTSEPAPEPAGAELAELADAAPNPASTITLSAAPTDNGMLPADAGADTKPAPSSLSDGAADAAPLFEIVDDLSVLIIFDNSGSMDAYWDEGSRWSVANQALHDALAPVATSLKVAAIRFPLGQDCTVPAFTDEEQFGWQLAGEFLEEWSARKVNPIGSTPLGGAFLAADQAIAEASERGLLKDRFNVIVLTDGEPNCDTDPALLTDLPAKWLERGVHTHVLGLPGSDGAVQLLNDIASAGGTEEYVALGAGQAEDLTQEVTVVTR